MAEPNEPSFGHEPCAAISRADDWTIEIGLLLPEETSVSVGFAVQKSKTNLSMSAAVGKATHSHRDTDRQPLRQVAVNIVLCLKATCH